MSARPPLRRAKRPTELLTVVRRLQVLAALLAGLALVAGLYGADRVAIAAIVTVLIINAVATEALRSVVANLRETRP